jgi:hypothetical protein
MHEHSVDHRLRRRSSRRGIRASNVEEIGQRVELHVHAAYLPEALRLGSPQNGDPANRYLCHAEFGLPDDGDLGARVWGGVGDVQGQVIGLI